MIITIANQKGGVGKTTTSVNLSAGLAFLGKRVLVIDMDPQANSTVSFIDPHGIKYTVFDLLENNEVRTEEVIRTTPIKNLDIIPASISLAKLESKLVGEIDGHFRLKDRIDSLKHNYDVIIVDTPPTLGLITINTLVAATHLLIPIQASYYALEGTDDLLETYEKVKNRSNPDLAILGVLITLYDKRTVIAKDSEDHIKQLFGNKVFKTIISKNVRLEESPAYKESIFTFAPESKGAHEYHQLAEEVLNHG